MKYCKICGHEMDDDINYCPKCGELAYDLDVVCCQDGEGEMISVDNPETAENEAMEGFAREQADEVYFNMQNMGMNQNMQNMSMNQNIGMSQNMQNIGINQNMGVNQNMQNMGINSDNSNKVKEPGKNIRRNKAIKNSIIVLLAVAIILATVILIKNNTGKSAARAAQEKALEKYYDAINSFDLSAIRKAQYPEEILAKNPSIAFNEEKHLLYYYTDSSNGLGFSEGIASYEFFKNVPCVKETYLGSKGGGFTDEQLDRMILSGFSASYEIVDSQKITEIRFAKKLQTETVDITEYIFGETAGDEKIEEAYLLNIHKTWSYGDNLYGNDKDWWEDEEFTRLLDKYDMTDAWGTYELATKDYQKMLYKIIAYKYKGKWYIYDGGSKFGKTSFIVE